MKDRMFVIPGGFVPYNDVVTLLAYKRLRNLDLEMDVFSFKGKVDEGIKKELENDPNFSKFNIKYTSDIDWAIPRFYPYRLPIGLFLMNKYVHDSLIEFEKKEYKYLFSSIVPGISHIAAYKIKKKHPEVKWYASFSDPFKGSPYKNSDLSNNNLLYKIMFNVGSYCLYNDKYEEVAVNNADKLIFICPEQRDFTLKQYPNYEELLKKAIVMPLTYIPDWNMYKDIIDSKKPNNEKLIAVHLGRLYGLRRPTTFIEALKELKKEDEHLSDKIEFHQYSEIQDYDVQKIKEYGLEDLFIIHDKVSYDKSIKVMEEADILVLFDTLLKDKEVQPYLPSKIIEYLLFDKPILAICDDNSPSYRILKENGYDTVGSDTETIKNNIKAILSNKMVNHVNIDKYNSDKFNMLEL